MGITQQIAKLFRLLPWGVAGVGLLLLFVSCSKEETVADEWDNWQQRNAEYLNYVVNCCQTNTAPALVSKGLGWKRLKAFSKDAAVEGSITDYVYAYVIEEGAGTESPAYTDSVRVIYQGRLIPTDSYPEGYVFSSTVYGKFSVETSSTAKGVASGFIDGFSTALQYMHRGDHWRVYIPNELGYGTSDQTNNGVVTIPGSSLLVFEIQLVDFSPADQEMPTWKAREK